MFKFCLILPFFLFFIVTLLWFSVSPKKKVLPAYIKINPILKGSILVNHTSPKSGINQIYLESTNSSYHNVMSYQNWALHKLWLKRHLVSQKMSSGLNLKGIQDEASRKGITFAHQINFMIQCKNYWPYQVDFPLQEEILSHWSMLSLLYVKGTEIWNALRLAIGNKRIGKMSWVVLIALLW